MALRRLIAVLLSFVILAQSSSVLSSTQNLRQRTVTLADAAASSTYTLSGRVTDNNGNGLARVMLTANLFAEPNDSCVDAKPVHTVATLQCAGENHTE